MYNAENELDLPSRAPLGVDADVALCRQLPGFIVPLDFEGMETSEFLLVPYFGACIHVPPPPSNQIVYVKTVAGYPLKELFDPVWVTGEMRTQAYLNAVGASATARAFLEAQLRQQHNMAQDLEEEQTKHKSRGHGMSL